MTQTLAETSNPIQAPELRAATFHDYSQIIALEQAQNLRGRTYEEWSSLWLNNPAYHPVASRWPIGWVLENPEGRIVGTIGNVPLVYHFRGQALVTAAGRAWAVEPAYRGFALALMAEFFSQPGVQLFLNTTVNGLAREPFEAFGSAPAPVGQWDSAAYWVTRYRGFAESALRLKGIPLASFGSVPAGLGLYLRDLLTRKRLPPADPNIAIERLTQFDERFDRFWERVMKTSTKLIAQRDRDTLQWHFAPAMAQARLFVLAATEGAGLAGYAILQRKDLAEAGLRRLRIVDVQVDGNRPGVVCSLLRRAMVECERQDVHVLEQVGCGVPKTALVDQYAPYRRRLPSWCFYYQAAGEDGIVEALSDPDAWDPSSFDGDSSF